MAGFLDEYGAGDVQRNKKTKKIVVTVLLAIVLGGTAFLYFRNWSEERAIHQFLALLQEKKYQDAYKLWGNSPDTQRYYPAEKFLEDFGPDGLYKQNSALKILHVDACDAAVVFHFTYPQAEDFGLFVDRSTNTISFAPWPRCPGPHLQVWEFIKSRFGG
jgi:hypothetical protein